MICSIKRNNYRFISFLAGILLIVFSLPVYAQENREGSPQKHFLWAVQSGKNTVYLLGSIHILKKDDYPLPETIEKAYGCCGKIVFETDLDGMKDPASQNKMTRLGLYPAGQTLSKNISAQTHKLLREKAAAANVPLERLEQFKPWFVAIAITALEVQRLGYDPEMGVDRYFFNRAQKDGKEMAFLETNEQQLNLKKAVKDFPKEASN